VQRFGQTYKSAYYERRTQINMRARRDNRELGPTTLTDFHKVKVIFVGQQNLKVYEFAW